MRPFRLALVTAAAAVVTCAPCPPPARADNRLVRASAQADAYAVAINESGRDARVWLAARGGAPRQVPVPADAWILDAAVDAGGALWLAAGIPREGPVRILRFDGPGVRRFALPGTTANQEALLLVRGEELSLATPGGLWALSGHGGRRAAAWRAGDPYGFYAASFAWVEGAWIGLVPTFHTCSSSDLLEELRELQVAATGQARVRRLPLPPASSSPWYGADGVVYSGGRGAQGKGCELRRRGASGGWPLVTRLPPEEAEGCLIGGHHNGRFTVVQLGRTVLRLEAGAATPLGSWEAGRRTADVYPDHRGRALVLFEDGALLRYAQRGPPEDLGVLGAGAP